MSFRDHEMAATLGRLVLAYDGAIAGLALASFAAVSWVKYLAASAALVRIRRATSVPISGLRSLLSSNDSSDEDGVLVVVRGRVQPSSTVEALGGWPLSKFRDVLTPRGSGERAVAVLSTQTVNVSSLGGHQSSDMTKDELEAELNSNTMILLWSGILLGTLSIGILGYALVRYCDSTQWCIAPY
ncbi:hypothetical protein GW17_00049929, partial [Ensete ventricosum]